MPPKKATKAAAPAAQANTKAKITKPAPTTQAKTTKTETTKTATTSKTTRTAAKSAPKKSPAEAKTTATTTTKKAAPKKAVPSTTTTSAPAKSTKRKADDDAPTAPAKKTKVAVKGAVINEPPTERLNVYVFGEGTAGELGLGTAKGTTDVKRPRLNPNLAADKVGVVQLKAGGMHVAALTHDNKILTWGVNDQGALGRDTTWDGGLKDMDADEDSESSDDGMDNGLNPKESMPGEVDFSSVELAEDTRWVQVTAGDSCTFALTDDGRVYGWGTFRANEGIFGFDPDTHIATRPKLIPDLRKIKKITAGANHVLALDSNGAVFAWGSGQQNQLGRRIVERTKLEGLKPREFGLPKGPKKGIVNIEAGSYHSFAIDHAGTVYGWGLNNFGETGIPDNAGQDDANILKPIPVKALQGKVITSIAGGGHHSLCTTDNGDCLVWGRMDSAQSGISSEDIAKLDQDIIIKDEHGKARILTVPTKVTAILGEAVHVSTSSDHSFVITKEGKAWSWGFSANYQTGQGTTEDIVVATMIDNTAVREQKITYATTGGQFGILTSIA